MLTVRLGLGGLLLAFATAAGAAPLNAGAPPLPLSQGKAALPVSVDAGTIGSYFIDLPSNVSTLTVRTLSASGNVDLLLRRGIQHSATTVAGVIAQSAAVATTASGNEQVTLTRNSPNPLTPGRWFISLLNTTAQTITLQLDATFTVSGPAFALTAGQSGAWYEPAKNFQGFFLEMLSPTTALTIWFTYQPDGKQAYMVGVGTVSGDTITFAQMGRSHGPKFGSAFRTQDLVNEDWGSVTMTFDGCNRGYASYRPSDLAWQRGWPTEQLDMERLVSISGLNCPSTASAAQAKFLRGGSSGAWFQPDHNGEGWLVEAFSDSLALIYWFTYTATGEQAWWGGVGEIRDGSIFVNQGVRAVGGLFGENYNPAQVTLSVWGQFAMTYTGCNTAIVAAAGDPAFDPSTGGRVSFTNVQRITTLAGSDPCGFALPPVAVGGSAQALGGTFADGDTNNPATPNRDNDAFGQEQILSNPALVAGFIANTGTGHAGDRFENDSDLFDIYQVNLVQGQVMRLAIADHDANDPTKTDFDLYLYPSVNIDPNQPIATAEGTGPNEQIIAPSTGTFDIVVVAFKGHGNYLLLVDNAGTALATVPGALSSLSKAVPGDIIAALKQPEAGLGKAASKAAELGLQFKAGSAERAMLFNVGDATQAKAAAKALGVAVDPMLDPASPWFLRDPGTRAAHQQIGIIKALRARPEIAYAEPNGIATAQALPNDQYYPLQWHYPLIHLPEAWNISTGSRNVVVAVIDTGAVNHPDLLGNLDFSLGYDFISDPLRALDGDGMDPNAFDVGDRKNPDGSSSFHGTHVAGTVGAVSNNGIGVAGVNWATTLMPVRVLGQGEGNDWDIAQGILWAARLPNDSGTIPARRADVINMSLGRSGFCPEVYASAIAAARSAGVSVIAAAGNDHTQGPATPANCPGVVSVSAVDRLAHLAPYSNFGPNIDVAAPGGDMTADRNGDGLPDGVLSTLASDPSTGINRNPYNLKVGTSMAAPHVAGVVALMKSVFPALSPQQFDGLLMSGAITTDLANNGPTQRDDLFGWGLIDAAKAVGEARRLATAQTLPPVAQALPAALDFGSTLNTQNVVLSNAGQGTLSLITGSVTKPWITVTPVNVNAQGLGSYAISVNRSGLTAANYSGRVDFNTTAGLQSVTVAMRVGAPQGNGDVSTVYVLLIDPLTGVVAYQARSQASAGNYAYTLPSVLQGNYYVLAGTDMDHDNFICDPGEACGALFTLSDPALVRIDTAANLGAFLVIPDLNTLRGLGASSSTSTSNSKRRLPDSPAGK